RPAGKHARGLPQVLRPPRVGASVLHGPDAPAPVGFGAGPVPARTPARGAAARRGVGAAVPAGSTRGVARAALEWPHDADLLVVATSAANDCHYCVVAHGALVRVYEKEPLLADQVATNYRRADITPRQRAMLDFAMKVALRSAEIEEADFARLREHGFTDEDGWDIASIAAFFGMSNRIANAAGMRPNDEFYL